VSLYPWQEKAWGRLNHDNAKLHHAYLFIGALGSGLEEFANTLAMSLICSNLTSTKQSCGICQDCQWALTEHPNLKIINNSVEEGASKNISIESIRNLKRFLELSSHKIGGNKVILINNAESLTLNAANSLLKMLEEPPENSYLILTTDNISSLLPTIVSRCAIVSSPKPTHEEAKSFLKMEGHENLSSQLPLFNNLPMDVIIHQENSDLFKTIISEFEKGKDLELMSIQPKWLSGDFPMIIGLFQKWLYDIFLFKMTSNFHFFESKKDNIKKLSDAADISKLLKLVKSANKIKLISNKPINKDITFDTLMVEYRNVFK
jgi:DNA polymerase-3 subunit delta'